MHRIAIIVIAAASLAACHGEPTKPDAGPPITTPQHDYVVGTESTIPRNREYHRLDPDVSGRRVVWFEGVTDFEDVYMYDLDSGTETLLRPDGGLQWRPAISEDLVVWWGEEAPKSLNPGIFVYNLTTGSLVRHIPNDDIGMRPDVSGSLVVYSDFEDGSSDIYLYNAADDTESQITFDPADQGQPAISGDSIVWVDSRNGNQDIYLHDHATGQESQITSDPAYRITPAISGNLIVWADSRNGNWDIYLYNVADGTESQITSDPADQEAPAISGNLIVWADSRNGNWDIYLHDYTTGRESQITSDPADQLAPAISGDLIVWSEPWRGGDGDIHVFEISHWVREADLSMTKTSEETGSVRNGDVVAFAARVENHGSILASGVELVDYLPVGLKYNSAGTSFPDCPSCSCRKDQALLRCDLGDIAPGSQVVGSLAFDVLEGTVGEVVNEALVSSSSPEADPEDNFSRATLQVIAEKQLPGGVSVALTISEGESGSVAFESVNLASPETSDGEFLIQFLGEALKVTLTDGASCSMESPCTISFTFGDEHLADAGLLPSQLDQVVVYHDPEEDGTFDPLPTTVVDPGPAIYEVEATIISTSYLGVGVPAREVDLDVKPGDENCLNPNSRGRVPAAVLATVSFDPADIDVSTLRLDGVEPINHSLDEDASGDGLNDLVLHFETRDLTDAGLLVDENVLSLIGSLIDGTLIKGIDTVYLANGPHCTLP